jgi:hypothetical protein
MGSQPSTEIRKNYSEFHVKWALCHHGMACPQVADGGHGLQIWRVVQMGSDKMIPRHVYDKSFTIRFHHRSEWKEGFQPDRNGGLIWYTGGSKTKALELGCIAMV